MWKLFSWLFLFSLTITGLEVTLNTQLDQKLEELKNNQKSNKYQYNILRKIEFVGLDKVDQQRIKNEISVVRGDVLDPYVINRNLKRIESLGFFLMFHPSKKIMKVV